MSIKALLSMVYQKAQQSAQEEAVQYLALAKIKLLVDEFWPEISCSIHVLKGFLSTGIGKKHKNLVLAIISKTYYHLGQTDLSFAYAIESDDLFDLLEDSPYSNCLRNYAINSFIKNSSLSEINADSKSRKISQLVLSIIKSQFESNDHSVIGVAIDARSITLFCKSVTCFLHDNFKENKKEVEKKISFIIEAIDRCPCNTFKDELVSVVCRRCLELRLMDPLQCGSIMLRKGSSKSLADLLISMVAGFEFSSFLSSGFKVDGKVGESVKYIENLETKKVYELLVLQLSFDIAESGDLRLIKSVLSNYNIPHYLDGEKVKLGDLTAPMETCLPVADSFDAKAAAQAIANYKRKSSTCTPTVEDLQELAVNFFPEQLVLSTTVHKVLEGRFTAHLRLQYLYSNCSAGAKTMGKILERIGSKNPVSTSGLLVAHGFARCGTGQDGFVRRNLRWFSGNKNWAKFSAVASLGVIHRGNLVGSRKLLKTFLPGSSGGQTASPFQEGGALLALGLIHCGDLGADRKFLVDSLNNASGNEIVQNGACLGLGLVSLGMGDEKVEAVLNSVLQEDNCCSGKAAGIALGLNQMGLGNKELAHSLFEHSTETKHEKITRGIMVGLALMYFERREEATDLILRMISSHNEILRYGAALVRGMAFIGTSNKETIRALLKAAATDVSSDVRRAAIMSIALVMCRSPERVPKLVRLFTQSFNEHSRYGAAVAIGISCVGTASEEALEMLKPLTNDPKDYVRNAAVMAVSMVLIQTGVENQKAVTEHYRALKSTIRKPSSKDFISFKKSGSIMAMGLLGLSSGNSSISLLTPQGAIRPIAAAGLLVFMQSWHWFPFYHFLGLAVSPTAFMGVTTEFKLPRQHRHFCFEGKGLAIDGIKKKEKVKQAEDKLSFSVSNKLLCRAKSNRKIPVPLILSSNKTESHARDKKESEQKSKIHPTISLSEKENTVKGNKPPLSIPSPDSRDESAKTTPVEVPKGAYLHKTVTSTLVTQEMKNVKKLEAAVGKKHLLENPCRVTQWQEKYVGEIVGQRYKAVKRGIGIVLLCDTTPRDIEDSAENRYILDEQRCQ